MTSDLETNAYVADISFESFLVRDENGCFYKRIVPAK